MRMNVLDAARHLVESLEHGASSIAQEVGKSPSTLSHELSESGGAKLGLATAVLLTKRTGDPRILTAFASECGYMVLKLPDVSAMDDDALKAVSETAREFSEFIASVAGTMADGKVKDNELLEVRRELGELIAAAQQIEAMLAAKNKAGKPKHLRAA